MSKLVAPNATLKELNVSFGVSLMEYGLRMSLILHKHPFFLFARRLHQTHHHARCISINVALITVNNQNCVDNQGHLMVYEGLMKGIFKCKLEYYM